MEFVAIDVETANPNMSSICQIGIALFRGESLIEEWKTYVDPEDYFDEMNIWIHGITEEMVRDAPKVPQISSEISRFLENRISVCHTHFDRVAVRLAFEKYNLSQPNCVWLDSARVARRAWDEFSRSGYGLYNVCSALGYKYNCHDALEDAKASARVLNSAIKKSGLNLEGWLKRVNQPINPTYCKPIRREGNPEGPMYGEILVFTGSLSITRREAADLADQLGCRVDSSVTKETTILVVGDQDVTKLAGHKKSSKHRKTEKLISKGQAIRIIKEADFKYFKNC